MPASPFQAVLEALVRPLAFAAEDAGRAAPRLRDLEAGVRAACQRARDRALPRDFRDVLARIEADFAEPLEGEARTRAVARALERLAPFRAASFPESALARGLEVLPGVGPVRAESLARRGLENVGDLLFRLPSRYDDRRSLVRVGDLEVGRRATFIAEVKVSEFTSSRGRGGRFRRIFEALVGDDTGSIKLKWFRGGEALAGWFEKGTRLLVTGDVKRYRFSKELVHPDVERLGTGDDADPEAGFDGLRRIVPDYPYLDGIPPRTLRRLIHGALDEYADLSSGYLPARLVRQRNLPSPADALRAVHRPEAGADIEAYRARRSPAYERLVLEELYLLEAGLALRHAAHGSAPGIALDVDGSACLAAPSRLPFRLTEAQQRVWGEIRRDLGRPHPMNRLLQGDVGSGKTAVAYLAARAAAASGKQSVLLAPTELLAEQHARTLTRLDGGGQRGEAMRTALLTASLPRPEAEALRAALARGDIDLVVGTHALVQPDVQFARLALVVVDEQHRFGVRQRQSLLSRGEGGLRPHTLVMTATPIPRTLALTLYGDLDLSVIDALPPGRAPVETLLLRKGEGRRIVERIRATVARGEQVYVVYPLVEESEKIDLRSATESAERIRAAFPECAVDLVHGRLDAGARAAAMARFESGETRILVSTTVIEVGVDVAGATLMVVEHAERFGLSQLHQLRGRVGRGDKPGTCILVSRGGGEDGEARLRAMLETTDGFRIADADLRIRGPGEFLGTRQHGHLPDLRVADLLRDARLLGLAREAAQATVRRDPGLANDPALRRAVEVRWGSRLALGSVG